MPNKSKEKGAMSSASAESGRHASVIAITARMESVLFSR